VSASEEKGNAERAFKFLFSKFHGLLQMATDSNRDLAIAIRGFGYLAEACRLLMTESDLKLMFELIAGRSEQLYSSTSGECVRV
jgi:DNA-dependent protein kinase catalytic subunit